MTKRLSMQHLIRLGIIAAVLVCLLMSLLFPSVAVKLVHAQNPTDLIRQCDFHGIIPDVEDIPPQGNSIVDYNLTDNWGGTWCDAEKTLNDTDDDLMCWAAAASNVLEWTGWGFVRDPIEGEMTNCDQIFEHINDHCNDTGGWAIAAWTWWFNGTGGPAWNVPGGGNFWPNYTLDDYYHTYSGNDTLQYIDEYLSNGWGVAIGVFDGAHEITCWGFKYDDTINKTENPRAYYKGVWVTDSDNSKGYNSWDPPPDTIRYFDVFYNDTGPFWQFSGPGYSGWHITKVEALEKNTFLEPDLAIYKTAYPDVVMAGEELFYNITVVNENTIVGGVTAYNVVVTDTLPIGVTYISDTGGCIHVSGNTYNCSLGDIAPGDSKSFTIKVLVDPDYVIDHGNDITNTATVTSDTRTWESDLRDNEATVTTYVQTEADLSVIKICKPDTWALAGEYINYTIIVENLGPSTARNVVVTDEIRSSGIFTVVSITAPDYVFAPSPPQTGQTITLVGTRTDTTMDVGERDIIKIKVRASNAIGFEGEAQDINNIVIVESAEPDPDLSNNQAEQSIDVDAVADLRFGGPSPPGKTDSSDPVYTGQSFIYTLLVTNIGPSTAVNVIVKDWMPAGLSINNATPSKGEWNAGVPGDPSRPTTWFIGSMQAGETCVMTINVTVLKPADLSLQTWILHNDAMVSSDTLDLDNSDNLVTEDTTVINTFFLADLKVTKFVKPDTEVLAGENITYTIIVENLGPSYAYHVCIRDEILSSDNFTIVDIDLDPFRLDAGAFVTPSPKGGVTYEVILLDPLEPKNTTGGGRWFIQIVVRANETQDINNLVNVFSSDIHVVDPDLSNNEAQCSIHVTAVADLEITKTDKPDPVFTEYADPPSRMTLNYTLVVTNHGPSTAVNVLVEDFLPAGVIINSLRMSISDCWNAGVPGDPSRPTRCAIGSLAPGESATIGINVTVLKITYVIVLRNDARVSSDILDPDNSNNFASVDTHAGPSRLLRASIVGENPIGNWYLGLTAIELIILAGLISSIAGIIIVKRPLVKQFIARVGSFLKAEKQ